MTMTQFQQSADRYIHDRVMPGTFVKAVLANDLLQAVFAADPESLQLLPTFTRWVYDAMPANLVGTYDKLNQHVNGKAG